MNPRERRLREDMFTAGAMLLGAATHSPSQQLGSYPAVAIRIDVLNDVLTLLSSEADIEIERKQP